VKRGKNRNRRELWKQQHNHAYTFCLLFTTCWKWSQNLLPAASCKLDKEVKMCSWNHIKGTERHLPYRIMHAVTCQLTQVNTPRRCSIYLPQGEMEDSPAWLKPISRHAVTHSSSNRAQRKATSSIETKALINHHIRRTATDRLLRLINQSINQSINHQSINQSINQSITNHLFSLHKNINTSLQ